MGIADKYRRGAESGRVVNMEAKAGVLEDLPALAEFLTQDTWADGAARQLPTLMLFVDDGLWKCCVNDRAEERSAWAAGVSVDACLAAIDLALSEGNVEWRSSWGKGRRKS